MRHPNLTFVMAIVAALLATNASAQTASHMVDRLTINQIQFVGSHNSYKQAMPRIASLLLKQLNADAWAAIDYEHPSLATQLDLGLRKLELDVFVGDAPNHFPVGHIQHIDMNSHCPDLTTCLGQLRDWSHAHPTHLPIWLSFNAKDQSIDGLPDPEPFTEQTLVAMDNLIERELAEQLIRPRDVVGSNGQPPTWPTLENARGKFLLILDEQGRKREWYWQQWRQRPMFTNAPADHPAAAIMIINDPIAQQAQIRALVTQGYLVRTRADADTKEARANNTLRRDAAFASGAQAISTDYYQPSTRFESPYVVTLPGTARCNPINTPANCQVPQHVAN